MRTSFLIFGAILSLSAFGCRKAASPKPNPEPTAEANAVDGVNDGKASRTQPEVVSPGGPVETGPPNVPEFKPAFEGQTRAPAIQTRTPLQVTEIADGFDRPWAIEFLPSGHMLITEKVDGELFVLAPDGKKSPPVTGVPKVDGGGQGGLLDVALDPNYENNQVIYLSYYQPRKGGNGLAVARARLTSGETPKLDDVRVIFEMKPTLDSDMHAGGRIVFASKDTLFVTLGERSVMEGRMQAQKLDSHFGKIVRIHTDGTVPQDNPFVDRPGALPEIWSVGHRNVLGADFDSKGQLWIAEMGPRGGDELNLVERGKDYGWPTIGYGEEYSGKGIHKSTQAEGMEQPVYYWDPVISPGAMLVYKGDLISEWKGNFLVAGLSSKALIRLSVQGNRVVGEERLLTDRKERIREVVQGPDGSVALLTDSGQVLKVTPK
jgi:aldose sugar dehydrogenase